MDRNLKIMVTGKNRRIAVDICKHLESDRDYFPIKCAASKTALLDMTLNELPNVIIICSGSESSDTVKIYDVLKETARSGAMEIIVVANEEDRKLFMGVSELEKITFISRPVSLTALYRKLEEIEESIDEYIKHDKERSLIEYENQKKPEEFKRKHILVVDDEPEQLIVIKDQLKEFYEVTVINGGKNIFKILAKYKVDLILLDYMMPEMDGPQVLKMLREDPEYAEIPVVFLTGMADKDAVLKLFVEFKPQGYVLKPSKKSEIVAKIIDVLG